MHLLPQSFEFRRPTPPPKGTSVGTAALLLPVAVRFFLESLPYLLPRQAFSVLGFGVPASFWLLSCTALVLVFQTGFWLAAGLLYS